jgi:hypothetical protein
MEEIALPKLPMILQIRKKKSQLRSNLRKRRIQNFLIQILLWMELI